MAAPERRRVGCAALAVALVLIAIFSRWIASYIIEIEWWKELGQLRTWMSMLYYAIAPVGAATVFAFVVLWVAHARALKFARTGLGEHPVYTRVTTLILLGVSWIIANLSIDTWTVVRYAGSRGLPPAATAWHDSVFSQPLSFYLFDLPFYLMLRSYVLGLVIVSILVYWAAARAWQLRAHMPQLREARDLDVSFFHLEGALESKFMRGFAIALLLALGLRFYLGRYEMVYNEHGSFLVGVDYVDANVTLPLQWLLVIACIAASVFIGMGRWRLAAWLAVALALNFALPPLVSALYVRPNEISLQK